VRNTFLQGTLEEEVYMTLSSGHKEKGDANLVCKLSKIIYKLKQSPCASFEKLNSYLISYNFKKEKGSVDNGLF
jgi:Reverse transcriptase (RNA-dependent DNA polymerase)